MVFWAGGCGWGGLFEGGEEEGVRGKWGGGEEGWFHVGLVVWFDLVWRCVVLLGTDCGTEVGLWAVQRRKWWLVAGGWYLVAAVGIVGEYCRGKVDSLIRLQLELPVVWLKGYSAVHFLVACEGVGTNQTEIL